MIGRFLGLVDPRLFIGLKITGGRSRISSKPVFASRVLVLRSRVRMGFMWSHAGSTFRIYTRKTTSEAAEFKEWVCLYLGKIKKYKRKSEVASNHK